MKYVIEFDLPDNDTVLNNIKTAWVGWNVWGYSGIAHAKPKQPERKKGKWILVTDNNGQHCVCDHCGEWKYHQGQKFCGECGYIMTEEV